MDIKKWLALQLQEARGKRPGPKIYEIAGVEVDLDRSIAFGDEWFFKLVNGRWAEIVPGLHIETAVHAVLTDCVINLYLNQVYTREELHEILDDAIDQGLAMAREWPEDDKT